MTEVEFPFLPEFKDVMLCGKKTKTARTRRYGRKGDWFFKFGATFKITDVSSVSLRFVANEYYLDEGFNSDGEFVKCWKRLHPRKGFVPDQMVWLHSFRRIQDESE